MTLGTTTATLAHASLIWNGTSDNTTSVTISGLDRDSYYSLYATSPLDATANSPVVTEDSLNAMIDKRLDERLKKCTFAERLQMKYPMKGAA